MFRAPKFTYTKWLPLSAILLGAWMSMLWLGYLIGNGYGALEI